MMRKSFSFIDYINREWLSPAKIVESFGMDYAGSDAVSKVPLLFQYDEDWAFLSQFPPTMWTLALYWRYNEGLLQASESREQHSRKHVSAIKDWVPQLALLEGGNRHVFTGIPGKGIYVGYNKMFTNFEKPVKLTADYKAGTDYGYRPLANTSKDGPSIRDIDVFAKNPEDVKEYEGRKHHHRSQYKDGTVGMDMSRPERITPEFIDTLPDDDPLLAKVRGKTVEEKKKKLKEEPPHSMAGMPTMSKKTATKMIQTWIRAQGLGLLGGLKVGDNIPDPITGGQLRIVELGPPRSITKYWPSHVGKDDGASWQTPDGQQVGGQPRELSVPIVEREIGPWYTTKDPEDKDENLRKWKPASKIKIPVLLTSTLLPTVPMTPEQKEAFAKRGIGGSGEDEEDEVPSKKRNDAGSGMTTVLNLLNNADLLAPEQMQHLQDNKRDQMHVLARQADKGDFDKKFGDPHSVKYYNVGWTVNKASTGMFPHNLSKEQMKKVIEEYVPENSKKLQHAPKSPCTTIKGDNTHMPGCSGGGLEGEAYEGIVSYMKAALGYKDAPSRGGRVRHDITSAVLQMMELALPDLVRTCAILLALRLNDPTMGIYDPDLGLTNLNPDFINKPESTRTRRVRFASKFARELEQACLIDTSYGTRRTRKKLAAQGKGGRREVSYTNQGEEEDREGNLTGAETGRERADDRERQLAGDDVGGQKHVWKTHEPENIARAGWLVPRFGNFADSYLNSKRNEIATKAGAEFNIASQRAKVAMKRASAIKETYIEEAERELTATVADPAERRRRATEEVDKTFRDRLIKDFPDLYGDLTNSQMQDALNAAKERGKYALGSDEDEQDAEREEEIIAHGGVTRDMMNQLIEQNIDFLNNILKFEEGDIYGVVYDEDQNPSVGIIDGGDEITIEELAKKIKRPEDVNTFLSKGLNLPREAINDYFVKFWMAIAKETLKPVSQEQAILDAQKLGYSPTEAGSPAKKPEDAQQSQAPQQPQVRTAAKDIRDLIDYIYEPEKPGESSQQVGATIRTLLQGLTGQKVALKNYFDQILQRILSLPKPTNKDRTVAHLIGDFLDDDAPAKI